MDTISDILEKIREERNLSKEDFSKLVGLTRAGYDYALKKGSWTFRIIENLAIKLELPLDYFSIKNHTITENRYDKTFLQKGTQVIGEVHESSVEYKSNNSSSHEQTIKILQQTIENLKEMNEIYKESMLANKQRADELFIEKQELKAELKQVKTLKK